jgi:hypothetical protein
LSLVAGTAHAEERDPRTAKPVPTLATLFPLKGQPRLVINPRPGPPVIYINGVRQPTPLTIKLTPTRKPVACRSAPQGATCRIIY